MALDDRGRLTPAEWAWTLVAAVTVIVLAANLPAHGFFSGDSGVKLVMARHAVAHPFQPSRIDPPRIGNQPAPDYMGPFFVPHEDHAHAIQTPLLPILTAPFIASIGLRGAYVLPAVAFVVLVPLLGLVRRRMQLAAWPGLLAFLVVGANPLFLYALEFWEHTVASAALAAAMAFSWTDRRSRWIAAGICAGVAFLLRPEALWFLAGWTVALLWQHRRAAALYVAAAAGLVLTSAALLEYAHSGSFVGVHTAGNLQVLSEQWIDTRIAIVRLWLAPHRILAVAGLLLVAVAWALALAGRRTSATPVGSVGAALMAAAAAFGQLPRESLWQAAAVAGLALVPWPASAGTRALLVTIAFTTGGVVLTAPNDGGAQWGPRYLLIVTPALLLVAAEATTAALRSRQAVAMAAACVVLAGGVAVTRDAYRELRGSKQYYARLVEGLDATRGGIATIVTDLWWLDAVAASLHPRVTFLFVGSDTSAAALGRQIETAGVRNATVVTSATEPAAFGVEPRLPDSCFAIHPVARLPERDLRIHTATCATTR